MITLIFIMLVLAMCILFQEYRLNKLNRDYMSCKKAYCIHYVMDHIIDDWDKVAKKYCDVPIDVIDKDDLRDWAIKLLYDRKDFMHLFQCTLYQQMIAYVEDKYKEDNNDERQHNN